MAGANKKILVRKVRVFIYSPFLDVKTSSEDSRKFLSEFVALRASPPSKWEIT
tara:strand:- start:14 stop:172 length:159 start_codon:yes stop_codon:yes gene_type:complete